MPEQVDRRALVTGATGFIGRSLVRRLVDAGWETHAIVRPGSDVSVLPAGVRRHVDDGSPERLADAVAEAGAGMCFHLAARVVSAHRPSDVPGLVDANVAFPARLAEALTTSPGTLLVAAGTYWQHVGGAPYRAAALYAATKQSAEDILRFYADEGLLRLVVLKLPDTYGPGDPRRKILNLLMGAAQSGQGLDTTGGEQLVDLVHVDDVASAFIAAAETFAAAPAPLFHSYSVGSGEAVSVRTLAAKVEAITGRPIHARWGALPYRRHEMFEPWDAGARLPGWEPQIRLDDGIREMWCEREHSPSISSGSRRA